MNPKAFYDHIRPALFPLGFKQDQVDNIELIRRECSAQGVHDLRHCAYMLATVYHETAGEMRPIEEYGRGAGRSYGNPDPQTGHAYYGRGFPQLTGRDNYALFGRRFGVDLLNRPELGLDAALSARILVLGMSKGLFTGKGLAEFLPPGGEPDWVGARKTINGTDRAQLIANYAQLFMQGFELEQEQTDTSTVSPPPATPVVQAPVTTTAEPATAKPATHDPYETDAAIRSGATPQATRPKWWSRLLTSKINWSIIVTAGVHIAILFGAELTPEQEADITRLVYSVEGMVVLILRTFFNNPK